MKTKKESTTKDLTDYEAVSIAEGFAEGTEEDQVRAWQQLIDSGQAWRLQGSTGRTAMDLIRSGVCTLGPTGNTDYYGNYVPSKFEVKAGTKGSQEYADARRAEREAE